MSTGRKGEPPATATPPAAAKPREAAAPKPKRALGTWPLWGRILASIAIAWHLMVVFLSPMSVPPTSPLVASVAQSPYLRWYSDPLYLNHGYYFFAPDPGPGHLIEYTLTDANGATLDPQRFPSKRDQWPRLRYHRYMMLADQIDAPGSDEFRAARANFILTRFARQILREHPEATSVTVRRLQHNLTRLEDFLNGSKLDDPAKYVVQREVVQTRADVEAADKPMPPPSEAPPGNSELITPGQIQ